MREMSIHRFAAVLMLAGAGMAQAAGPVTVPPEGPPLAVDPIFSFVSKPNDSRRSLSGIACPGSLSTPRRCIAAFDEGAEARYVVISNQGILSEADRLVLLAGGKELDAEGAARDGDFVYVTGSFSAKRSNCADNLDSRHVLRFGVDPTTGRARSGPNGSPADLVGDEGRLWRLMAGHPVLGAFTGDQKCLGNQPPPKSAHLKGIHGVNIEGLAAKDGWLYFGFRGPAINGDAKILRVAAAPLFSGEELSDTLFRIMVGQSRGIRDLLAVPEGILVLIGPDDDAKDVVGWSIAFWDGKAPVNGVIQPKSLAHLALPAIRSQCDKEIKPEAVTMVEDGLDFRHLLILSDGMCDGGPLIFHVRK